ncbi:MAG: hypothetical protein HYZ53_18080 [Planctomycetes bacterium]|nr:hypothetical protein [Planctomycetota bacterium]
MANPQEIVAEAGKRLGFPPRSSPEVVFGEKSGCLVQLAVGKKGDNDAYLVTTVRFAFPGTGSTDSLAAALDRNPALAAQGIKSKSLSVKEGLLVYKRARGFFLSWPSAEDTARDIEAVLAAIRAAVSALPTKCRLCGGSTPGEPVLLDGIVDRVCAGCLGKIEKEVERERSEYETRPTNLPAAIAVAAVLGVIGAVGWAAITVATNTMFWLVAIGIGVLVGFGTAKAAGKGGLPVQALGACFTLLSVLLGQVLILAWHVHANALRGGEAVNWGKFAIELPRLLVATGKDTLFALGGGLFGAFSAAGRAAKQEAKPRVER